jgi:eukaryotic-like serine/threonine-protein kinase
MATETLQTIDKFIVLGNLGKGAKSTILKVQDPSNGQIYTIKRVIKESQNDNRFFEQAFTEYLVSSKLTHPYLRKSYEVKRVRNWLKTKELLVVMEYVEGDQLMQMVGSEVEQTIELFIKVAKGLSSLHDCGYVHADIKPKNILIVPDDGIKIIDFGQSCPMGHKKKRIQGTPDYMAPEQKERGFLDQRTDVFNLGATLYWVLTGQKFPTTMSQSSSGNGGSLSIAPSYRDIPKPEELNPVVPSSLSKLVMDCCNYNPKERPDNMREVIARFEVCRHLYQKQKGSQPVEEHKIQDEPEQVREPFDTNIPDDDSDDFEKFIESIL